MRIACLGGGPGGLYFAISMKLRNPAHEITVYERNRADDTFGWGVVLSDETLDNLAANDPISAEAIRSHFAYWDDIALVKSGRRVVSSGHGFCGIGRKQMLLLLQDRARELGVKLVFQTEIASAEDLARTHDLVVACDGLNSRTRTQFADHFQPDIDLRECPFVWLGTKQTFSDAFTFIFEQTEHGWIWAHAYQFDDSTATFIVECAQATYDAFGFEHMSKEDSIATCERIFRDHLGGHSLMSNAGHIPRLCLDTLPPRAVRTVEQGQYCPLGRCRSDGAFLYRVGDETGAGIGDCLGRIGAYRSRFASRLRQNTNPSAACKCCACNRRRAILWNGSNRSNATCTWTRCN